MFIVADLVSLNINSFIKHSGLTCSPSFVICAGVFVYLIFLSRGAMGWSVMLAFAGHTCFIVFISILFWFHRITKKIQILYSPKITTCYQHEVHNLTRLFRYNNTKWLIDLGREKSVLKT